MTETITIDKYTSLEIREFNGTYSIMEGWINQNGEFKPNFCKREFGKKGEKVEKTVPVTIKCGSKETLINLANYILSQYGEEAPF